MEWCAITFNASCIDAWRSKYDIKQITERTCPLCREIMPPSKEMMSQLMSWQRALATFEDDGDLASSPEYITAKMRVRK